MDWASGLAKITIALSPGQEPSMEALRMVSERILSQCDSAISKLTVKSAAVITADDLDWVLEYAETLRFKHG